MKRDGMVSLNIQDILEKSCGNTLKINCSDDNKIAFFQVESSGKVMWKHAKNKL
jgi:hypothetical protein